MFMLLISSKHKVQLTDGNVISFASFSYKQNIGQIIEKSEEHQSYFNSSWGEHERLNHVSWQLIQ